MPEFRFHKLTCVLTTTEHDDEGRIVNEHQGPQVVVYERDLDSLPDRVREAVTDATAAARKAIATG